MDLVEAMMTELQGYYGKYSPGQGKHVERWLRENMAGKSEKAFASLFDAVLRVHSATYKTQPGIKELEDARDLLKQEYREMKSEIKAYNPLQIEDRVSYEDGEKLLNELITKLRKKRVAV